MNFDLIDFLIIVGFILALYFCININRNLNEIKTELKQFNSTKKVNEEIGLIYIQHIELNQNFILLKNKIYEWLRNNTLKPTKKVATKPTIEKKKPGRPKKAKLADQAPVLDEVQDKTKNTAEDK